MSHQVALGNILPLISDAADSDTVVSTPAVRACALFTPPTLAISVSPRAMYGAQRIHRAYPRHSAREARPGQVAAQDRVDAPAIVPLPKAPASFPDVALVFGREKLLSSSEVEGTLKDWPTDEQASLGRADGSLEPLPSSYNSAICSRRFEPVVSAAPNSTYAGA